jgi:hypothetical protein
MPATGTKQTPRTTSIDESCLTKTVDVLGGGDLEVVDVLPGPCVLDGRPPISAASRRLTRCAAYAGRGLPRPGPGAVLP